MKFYYLDQVAMLLKVHPVSVRHWVETGELKATMVSMNAGSRKPHHRVSERQLEEFLQGRETKMNGKRPKRKPVTANGDRVYY